MENKTDEIIDFISEDGHRYRNRWLLSFCLQALITCLLIIFFVDHPGVSTTVIAIKILLLYAFTKCVFEDHSTKPLEAILTTFIISCFKLIPDIMLTLQEDHPYATVGVLSVILETIFIGALLWYSYKLRKELFSAKARYFKFTLPTEYEELLSKEKKERKRFSKELKARHPNLKSSISAGYRQITKKNSHLSLAFLNRKS